MPFYINCPVTAPDFIGMVRKLTSL